MLTDRQRTILEQLALQALTQNRLFKRIQILQEADRGLSNRAIHQRLGVSLATVRTWRRRWQDVSEELRALEEKVDDESLAEIIFAILHPQRMQSRNAKEARETLLEQVTGEQKQEIVAIAHEDPAASGRDIEFWTMTTLADEAVRRGIVQEMTPQRLSYILRSENFLAIYNKRSDSHK